MKKNLKYILENKHLTMPILSFPSTQLLSFTVKELLADSQKQADGMEAIMNRCPLSASLNMMDLSVEAEVFGAKVHFEENEIPTIVKGAIDNIEDSVNLKVPNVGDGRTGIYIEGVRLAKVAMPHKLIMCGVIGPFSLAGRLFDMTELMMACYDDPDNVEVLLNKATDFIIEYIKAYIAVGADGVVMAEPASGLLSPSLFSEFSAKYVKKIFDAVNDENFVLVYHNCGNTIPLIPEIEKLGADIYHFGNAIDIKELLNKMSSQHIIMGNINPVNFRTSNPTEIYNDVTSLLKGCSTHDNFIISSGCDIPSNSSWENIDAYFNAVKDFYGK